MQLKKLIIKLKMLFMWLTSLENKLLAKLNTCGIMLKTVAQAWHNVEDSAGQAWHNFEHSVGQAWHNVEDSASNAWHNVEDSVSHVLHNVEDSVSQTWHITFKTPLAMRGMVLQTISTFMLISLKVMVETQKERINNSARTRKLSAILVKS